MIKAMVKKAGVFLLLTAMFVFISFATVEASVILIKNSTGADIYEMYISDSEADGWEEDVLGRDILENGETLRLRISGSYRQFDMSTVDGDGNSVSWYGLPGNVSQITIFRDGTAEYR
jgi:hypothetical protein